MKEPHSKVVTGGKIVKMIQKYCIEAQNRQQLEYSGCAHAISSLQTGEQVIYGNAKVLQPFYICVFFRMDHVRIFM